MCCCTDGWALQTLQRCKPLHTIPGIVSFIDQSSTWCIESKIRINQACVVRFFLCLDNTQALTSRQSFVNF